MSSAAELWRLAHRNEKRPEAIAFTSPGVYTFLATPLIENDFADGATVNRASDFAGCGNFLQGYTAKSPTFVKNVINGYPVIRFDGTQEAYFFRRDLNCYVYSNTFIVAWCCRAIPVTKEGIIFVQSTNTGSTRCGATVMTTGALRVGGRRNDADAYDYVDAGTGISVDEWVVHSFVFDWQNKTVRVYSNGVLDGEDTNWLTAGYTAPTYSAYYPTISGHYWSGTPDYLLQCDLVGFAMILGKDDSLRQYIENYFRAIVGV